MIKGHGSIDDEQATQREITTQFIYNKIKDNILFDTTTIIKKRL